MKKTVYKKIIIDKNLFDSDFENSTLIHLIDNVTKYNENRYYVAELCVSVDEKEITITERDFDIACEMVNLDFNCNQLRKIGFAENLKAKLFKK